MDRTPRYLPCADRLASCTAGHPKRNTENSDGEICSGCFHWVTRWTVCSARSGLQDQIYTLWPLTN